MSNDILQKRSNSLILNKTFRSSYIWGPLLKKSIILLVEDKKTKPLNKLPLTLLYMSL